MHSIGSFHNFIPFVVISCAAQREFGVIATNSRNKNGRHLTLYIFAMPQLREFEIIPLSCPTSISYILLPGVSKKERRRRNNNKTDFLSCRNIHIRKQRLLKYALRVRLKYTYIYTYIRRENSPSRCTRLFRGSP